MKKNRVLMVLALVCSLFIGSIKIDAQEVENSVHSEPSIIQEDLSSKPDDHDTSKAVSLNESSNEMDDASSHQDSNESIMEDGKHEEVLTTSEKDTDEPPSPLQGQHNQKLDAEKIKSKYSFKKDRDTPLITENTVQGVELEGFRAQIDWSISNETAAQLKVGDYFEFELPIEVIVPSASLGVIDFQLDIKMDDGQIVTETVGYYETLKGDQGNYIGRIVFTQSFTASEVKGEFGFSAQINKDALNGLGSNILTFPDSEDTELTVILDSEYEKLIDKSGEINAVFGKQATWNLDLNKQQKLRNVVSVKDTLPDHMEYVGAKIFKLETDYLGKVTKVGSEIEPMSQEWNDLELVISKPSGAVEITMKNLDQALRIVIVTQFEGNYKPQSGNNIPVHNKVEVDFDGDKDDSESKLTTFYPKMVDKGVVGYNPNDHIIEWRITFNRAKVTLTDPKLEDVLSPEHEFVEGSMKVSNGQNVTVTSNKDPMGEKLDITIVGTVDQELTITYKTKIKKGVIIDHDLILKNAVKYDDDTSESYFSIRQEYIDKFSIGVDYENKRIGWTIQVNKESHDITDVVIHDKIPDQMRFLKESLKLINNAGQLLTLDKDYFLDYTEGADTFTIRLSDSQNKNVKIIYQTEFHPTSRDAKFGGQTKGQDFYKNKATIDWKENGKDFHTEGDAIQVVRPEVNNSGSKKGTYDPLTKEITWRVVLNYAKHELRDASFYDVILEGQKYVPESMIVSRYTLDNKGDPIPSEPMSDADKDATFISWRPDLDKDYLNIKFKNSTEDVRFIVEYKTSIDGDIILESYINRAVFRNEDDSFILEDTVKIPHGGHLVSKNGVREGIVLKWDVLLNQSQSTIYNAKIIDKPSTNQVLDRDSFKLYKAIITKDPKGKVTFEKGAVFEDDAYELTFSHEGAQETFEIKFKAPLTEAIYLDYESIASPSTQGSEDATNTIQLIGDNIIESEHDNEENHSIELGGLWGSGTGETGSIQIKKTDPDGNLLEGAEFILVDKNNVEWRKGTTDAQGHLEFARLPYLEFKLIETKAPKGFSIANELKTGITIQVSNENQGVYDVHAINRGLHLEILKLDQNNKPLAGVTFELIDHDGNILSAQTNESGVIIYESLPLGTYTLKETQTLEGLILDTTEHVVTIEEDANQNQTGTFYYELVNYKGRVEILKTDADANPLAGAKFGIYQSDDTLVIDNLVTDASGIACYDQLQPGKYYLKELEAPDGYELDATPVPFEIVDAVAGEPEWIHLNMKNKLTPLLPEPEPTPEPGPEIEPTPEPGPEIEPKPEPGPEIQPTPEPEIKPKPESGIKETPNTESKTTETDQKGLLPVTGMTPHAQRYGVLLIGMGAVIIDIIKQRKHNRK